MLASQSDQAIRQLKEANLTAEENARRARFANRHLLLVGDFRQLVAERLREVFADRSEAERIAIFGDATCNVYRFLVEELAVYSGAKRAFMRGTERDPVYAALEEQEEPFDLVMQEVTTVLFGLNDGLIQCLPAASKGRPRIRVFRPHECTVIPREDDPSQPALVAYEHRSWDGEEVTIVWTKEHHYQVTASGAEVPVPGASDTKNPLGRLPFAAIHSGLRPDGFWDQSTGQEDVDFTLDYLAAWAAVRWLMHQQSHMQLVAKAVDKEWQPPSKIGPGTIWKMGGNPNASIDVLDLRASPELLVEVLKEQLSQHIASKGLNGENLGQNPGQTPASGLALFLDRHRIIERRRKFHPQLVEAEYALAELYRWSWNVSNPEDEIDPEAEFHVELNEETIILSPVEEAQARKTRLEVIKLERELGLKSPVEQIAEERGISVEEARALLPSLQARPEIFAYDQENAIVTIDEVRASKGLGEHPDPEIGKLTLPQLRALHPEWFANGAGSGEPDGGQP